MRLVSFCAACEKRRPWADRGTTYWRRSGGRVGVTCARKSQQRAQRCAARLNKLCMRLRHACVRRQVACESEGLRAYAELQRKHRAAYGDNEEAREAAGKAALLRAKALLSSGWVARLRCVRSEGACRLQGAWWLRRCAGSVACASKCIECERERALSHGERERERAQACRV